MTGLEELRARAGALRWLHDLPIWREPLTQDRLRVLADMLEWSADTVARDYAEPAEAEAEPNIEPDDEHADATPPLPPAGEGRGDGPLGAANLPPMPRERAPKREWTEEEHSTLVTLRRAGKTASEIADALGVKPQRVADRLKTIPEFRGRIDRKRSSVPLPNPAEQQLAEDAAQAAVADADIATIRHWLETKAATPLAPDTPETMVLKHANDARRRFGLPPFRLVRNPIGAPSQDELARMTRAGEHHA